MPHYADGTECKVGDQVIAPVFNSGGPKAGVVISITPGVESCNAMVQFAVAVARGEGKPRMAVQTPRSDERDPNVVTWLSRVVRGEQHGNAGAEFDVYVCADYCDTNKLTKVG